MLDVAAYLDRIHYSGPTAPTFETLRALHLAHLYTVPFENLDIHLGRRIVLDEARFFTKVVGQRRGGFCYELNGLFAALLQALGFNVARLSAGVYNAEHDRFGPDCDHLCLLVQLEERWLADVGFGESFREPLRLNDPGDQVQNGSVYRVTSDGDEWRMMEHDSTGRPAGPSRPGTGVPRINGNLGRPADGYRFTLRPRRLDDFTYACHYMQTSAETQFTQKRVCTRATPEGRITLSDMRLIITAHGQREERLLADPLEYLAALKEYFGVDLPAATVFQKPAVFGEWPGD